MKNRFSAEKTAKALRKAWVRADDFSLFDVMLFAAVALFCFVSFIHPDIMYTGNRSWIMYDGITGFYDHVHEWTRDYGANYMATTFWLFALWNLPLKIFGFPPPAGVASTDYILWYKILPLLFFFLSIRMFRSVAEEIGLGKRKAKVAVYAFITLPVCFYSQFIFCQYDIVTVFFVLWGMKCYYRRGKGDLWRFALLFGIAVSCKYYAVLIFLVMLLVREKNPARIIRYALLCGLPVLAEILLYLPSRGFQISVLNFKAVDYIKNADTTALSNYSYAMVLIVLVGIWAYFTHADNPDNETAWTLFFSCGCCAGLFGLSTWHPQWLIFMAPFMVLSAFINIHLEKFLFIDLFFGVLFQYISIINFAGGADVNLLDRLLWSRFFTSSGKLAIANVLPQVTLSTPYSIYLAMLLGMFIFKHPRYALKDFSQPLQTDHMHMIRLTFLAGAGSFIIPAFITAFINNGFI